MDVCLRRVDPVRALEELPEDVQEEIDGDTDVRSDEVLVVPRGPDIEAVEENDDREEEEGKPREVWLEGRLKHEGIAVDSLGLERGVKFDVRDADAAPGEKTGDGGEILEPGEDNIGAAGAGHVCQKGD